MFSTTLLLEPDITGFAYDSCLYLSWFFILLVLFCEGHRRRYPIAAWMLCIALIISISILGSRLATFDWAAWQHWWEEGVFPEGDHRSSIAALLFFLLGLLMVRRGVGFRAPMLVVFAFVLPVLVIVRRLGCLLTGCCYGLPTESGWGIVYTGPSLIQERHLAKALVASSDHCSAAVHPVPLYLMIGAVVCGLVLWGCRGRFRQSGNLTLLSFALLLGFRFWIEFFRDPATNHQLGGWWLGLKEVQWVLLVSVLLLVVAIWARERRARRIASNLSFQQVFYKFPSATRLIWVNVLLAGFVFWMQEGFTFAEKASIHCFLLLSWVAMGRLLFRETTTPTPNKWQVSLVAAIAFGLMSQTYPYIPADSADVKTKYTSFKINGNYGDLHDPHYECTMISSGCSGDTCVLSDTLNSYGPVYIPLEIGIDWASLNRQKTKINRRTGRKTEMYFYTSFGIEGQLEYFYNPRLDITRYRGNVFPYFRFGSHFIEFKGGLRIGSIWNAASGGDIPFQSEGFNGIPGESPFVVSTAIRAGNPNKFYIQINGEHSSILGASAQGADINVNMNLNRFTNNKWQYLRMGLVDSYNRNYVSYLEAGINLTDQISLTPRVGLVMNNPEKNQVNFIRLIGGFGMYYRMKPRTK